MNLFEEDNWIEKLKPLLEKYKDRKHPLDYENLYQLMIAVILSAQDSDANINKITPTFYKEFPNLESLTDIEPEDLYPYINKVRNFSTKSNWIIGIAKILKNNKNIPANLNDLIALKGIGRKSANVILREMNIPSQGIITDLHVIRVIPRFGLTKESEDGNKIEKQLMAILPHEIWGEVGMAFSFLGREICRPTNPKCTECPINKDCLFHFKSN
ncbi:endonuclease III domain-containing protein [Flavobacterium sp.]|uniref:endonuclease III domain-containing protein n=1 Tax=Flavobacterium sp. TaxID=239 RepID=UPI003752858E